MLLGRRFARCERGSTAVFFAFGSMVFLGMAALTADVGMLYYTKARLQATAEAAALAAAKKLPDVAAAQASGLALTLPIRERPGQLRDGDPIGRRTTRDLRRYSQFLRRDHGQPQRGPGFGPSIRAERQCGRALVRDRVRQQFSRRIREGDRPARPSEDMPLCLGSNRGGGAGHQGKFDRHDPELRRAGQFQQLAGPERVQQRHAHGEDHLRRWWGKRLDLPAAQHGMLAQARSPLLPDGPDPIDLHHRGVLRNILSGHLLRQPDAVGGNPQRRGVLHPGRRPFVQRGPCRAAASCSTWTRIPRSM